VTGSRSPNVEHRGIAAVITPAPGSDDMTNDNTDPAWAAM